MIDPFFGLSLEFCKEQASKRRQLNGEEALKKIQTNSYDIALIDIVLGDSNGLDLLPKIKETSPDTIKIMITGADTNERRGEAGKNGADAYLTKPVTPEELLNVFQENLNLI